MTPVAGTDPDRRRACYRSPVRHPRPAVRAIALCWLVLQTTAFAVAPMAMRCLHDHTAIDACAQGHHGVAVHHEHGSHDHGNVHANHDMPAGHHGHGGSAEQDPPYGGDGPKMRCLCLVSEAAVDALTLGAALLPPAEAAVIPATAGQPMTHDILALVADRRLDTPPPRA